MLPRPSVVAAGLKKLHCDLIFTAILRHLDMPASEGPVSHLEEAKKGDKGKERNQPTNEGRRKRHTKFPTYFPSFPTTCYILYMLALDADLKLKHSREEGERGI